MRQWLALSVILLMCVAAIWQGERNRVDVPASPAAILHLIADTEQELTRMPVRFTRLSDQEEIAIGNEMARSYDAGNERKSEQTKEVEAYLNQVGARLVPFAHRKLPYRFHYIPETGFINAFALPGGHVYVGEGLLALMDSEDELASVIGHEMEHIDHYHCAERVQQEQALRKLPLGGLVAIPMEVFEAGYSKDQELEADREGTRLAVKAGYSANGAIRMFATFQRLYEEWQSPAMNPADELSRVTYETLAGYFRSHPLPSERIQQINTLIASEHWELKPERDLEVAYIFWTQKALRALEAHRYADAASLATQSLKLHAAQPRALRVLAQAQFAQARFRDAADSCHELLKLEPSDSGATNSFAMALAANNRGQAFGEFQDWREGEKRALSSDVRVPYAGLALLAGNAEFAAQLRSQLTDPELLGQLGWWYYQAKDYRAAEELLENALQQRPGGATFRIHLAWAQIELDRLNDALETLNTAYGEDAAGPERTMARAVTEWRAQQGDAALSDYEAALAGQPEWANPQWVSALYSSKAATAVETLQSEQEQRRKSRRP